MADNDQYEISSGGQIIGPVTLDLLRRGFEAGKIPSTAIARRVGANQWRPVEQVAKEGDLAVFSALSDDPASTAPLSSATTLRNEVPVSPPGVPRRDVVTGVTKIVMSATKTQKLLAGGAVVLALLLGLVLAGLAMRRTAPNSQGSRRSASTSPSAKDTANAEVGEVTVRGITWVVLDAVNRGQTLVARDPAIDKATTTGKFVQVHLRLMNNNSRAANVDAPSLVDAKGRTFKPYRSGFAYIPNPDRDIKNAALAPGIASEVWVIHEVAMDATGLALKISSGLTEFRLLALGEAPDAPPPTKTPPPQAQAAPTAPPTPSPPTAPDIQCKRSPGIDDICESSSKIGFNCWGGTSGDVEKAYPGCEYIADSQFCCFAQK